MSAADDLRGLGLTLVDGIKGAMAAAYVETGIRGQGGQSVGRAGPASVKRRFGKAAAAKRGWAPLSPEYDRRKRRKYPGKPMLVATGRLKRETTGQTRFKLTQGGFTVTWLSLPDYAIYHHTGTETLPKRSPVAPDADDADALRDVGERFAAQFIAGATAGRR